MEVQPLRKGFDTELLIQGLYKTEAEEDIPEGGLCDVDGFIVYQGLLKKDWALVSYTATILNNVNYYLDVSLPACDVGERGAPYPWPTLPPIPTYSDTSIELSWFSYFSGVDEITDYTTEGGRTFSVEAWRANGRVTFTLEEYNG